MLTYLSRTMAKGCLWRKCHKLSYEYTAMAEFSLLVLQKPHSKSLINRNETDRIQKENVHSQYCVLNFQTSFSQFDVACHKHPFVMSRLILRNIRWAAWFMLLGTSPHFLNQAFSRFIIGKGSSAIIESFFQSVVASNFSSPTHPPPQSVIKYYWWTHNQTHYGTCKPRNDPQVSPAPPSGSPVQWLRWWRNCPRRRQSPHTGRGWALPSMGRWRTPAGPGPVTVRTLNYSTRRVSCGRRKTRQLSHRPPISSPNQTILAWLSHRWQTYRPFLFRFGKEYILVRRLGQLPQAIYRSVIIRVTSGFEKGLLLHRLSKQRRLSGHSQ